jgi:mannose/fructose/N-acetylgalactosamine-specific phosphotransferase system component IID
VAAGILGFLVHMEKQGEEMGDQGLSLSSSLSALYGAVGDNFFWNGLKPMTSALAVMIFFWRPGLTALLFLLFFYNLVHICIRYAVYLYGVHRGIGVLEKIDSWRLPRLRDIMEYITTISLAVTAFLMVDYFNIKSRFGANLFYLLILLLVAGLWWYKKTGGKGIFLKKSECL